MKILFMGTPDFAVGILKAIHESKDHVVRAVVTQPDRPRGRSLDPVASPVKKYAMENGIWMFQPEKIKSEKDTEILRSVDADIFVVAAFGQILSKEILDIPPKGCINVHASLLPEYRGAAPIQWAIADGREYTGVTIQQMNEGVDTGDIISSSVVPISPEETGESLFNKLMLEGAKLITKTLDDIESGKATFTPQDESKATRAKILRKSMGRIDFTLSASQIERTMRAFTPWPGCFTTLDGNLLQIKKCSVLPDAEGRCGEVTATGREGITVACGEGALLITVLQPAGKREMSAHDFLLGRKLDIGTILGQ